MGEGGDAVKMTLTAAFILLILSGIAAGLYFGVTAFINKLEGILPSEPTSNVAPPPGGGGGGVVITPPNTVGAVNIQPWTDPAQGARLIDILSAVLEIVADLLGARLQKAIDDAEERRRRGFDSERGRVEEAERQKRSRAAADADADNARPVDDDGTRRALDDERAKAEEAERQKRSRAAGDADADNARPVDDDGTRRALDEERAKAEEAERGRQARAAGDADADNARPLDNDATRRALEEERAKAEEAEKGRRAGAAGDADANVRSVSGDTVQSALKQQLVDAEEAERQKRAGAAGDADAGNARNIDQTTVKGSIAAEATRVNENIKASGNDQLPKTPGSINPATVKGSLEAENARVNENIKASGNNQLPKTPGSAIDPTTVKGSMEAETVRVNENIKKGGIDELTKTPGSAIDPTTVKGSIAAEARRINENIKASGNNQLPKTPGSAIDPTTVQRSLTMKARAAFDNLIARAQPLLPFSTKVDTIPRTATLWTTKMVEGNHKLGDNGQPLKVTGSMYDTSHMSYMPSEKWYKTAFTSFGVGLSNMFQRNVDQMQALKDIMATEHSNMTARKRTPVFLSTTDEKSRMRSAFDYTMSSKVVSVTGALLGSIGDVMDVLGVVMLFTDAFYMDDAFLYYGQDRPPPGSGYQPKLLTSGAVNEAIAKSIDGQVKAIKDYNKMCRVMNAALSPGAQTYAYATYPQISGPLDVLERDMPRKTAYDTQARIVEEVNAVQEKLLRDPTTPHGALMQQRMGGQTYQYLIDIGKYNAQTNPGGKNMWWWLGGVDGYFAPTEIDNLYRAAFTAVCLYHKGVVYEDTHLGVDDTGATETQSSGRARFQCGWPTSADCIKASQKWVTDKGATGGNYAEWFNFDDLKGFQESGTSYNYTEPKVNKIPAANLTLLKRTNPGACIVYNSGIRQMCDTAKGHYNPISHQCVFSPQFCQSIGTCYDRRTKTCNLPPDSMKALGVFFGDYAPREYIRQNGCNYTSADDITQAAITSGDITTENGQDWKRDKAASNINLNANFRKLLSSPAYAAGFATSVTGLAQIASQSAITAAGEAVVDSGSKAAVSDAKATAALQKANKPVTTATVKAQRISMTASRLNMAIAATQILIIAFTIVSELVSSNQIRNQMPTDDIKEYTVGGWDPENDDKPITLSFANGWITKPLSITSITSTEAGGWNRKFYADSSDLAWKAGAGGIYENILSSDLANAIDRYTGYFPYPDAPARLKCNESNPRGILAGSKANADKIWCLPAFPREQLADASIGTLMSVSTDEQYTYTNRAWTNGKEPSYPQYPIGTTGYRDGAPFKPGDDSVKQWKYQLVYDKATFGDAHLPANKGMPTHLWNTQKLRAHFRDSKIAEMRRYYCQTAFTQYIKSPTQNPIDSKCFGYLSIDLPGYKFLPMTILARNSRMTPAV